ncbi:MAG TPA: AI-2E family transporter [Candidatus Paceibacterota bacterium]|nr:AI-2E family transporter [Candidatus Paceibacterota bacterium]
MTSRPQVDISVSSVFRALLPVVLLVLLYLLSDVLVIVLFAIVIASAVNPFVAWFEARRVPRMVAVLILYVMVAALIVLLSSLIVPSVSRDIAQLSSVIPRFAESVSTSLDEVQNGTSRYFDFVGEVQNILEIISGYLQQFSQSALSLLAGAFGGVFTFIAVMVLSFYFSVMRKGVESFLQAVVPERYEPYILNLWKRSEVKMGLWLQGQLLLALVVGLLVYVGLELLGVRFALILAIIAMSLELIPIAGPVIAAIPGIGLALVQDPGLAIWVFLLYLGVQQLENHVLTPLIMGKTTGLNPVVVILAILIGGNLAGIPGALLGVPVATVIVEVLDDIARAKTSRKAA